MFAQVAAPFQGYVTPMVAVGDRVERGAPLAVIEAMKMEAAITAPSAGRVTHVTLPESGQVVGGDVLVVLETA